MRQILLFIALYCCMALNAGAFDEVAWKASYVRFGEKYLGKAWDVLPLTEFARFKKDGNRVGYETKVFERRRRLAALAMAEIMERKGRFMPSIIDGIELMLEEPWWGIPAHYAKPVPLHGEQTVDLFNAESASLIAWVGKELRKELDAFSPEIYRKIEREINHRILKPALGSKYWWKKAAMNWNPWICSNWLTCVMLYERDSSLRQKAVTEIENCMKAFIDAYPEDGGCDEGTGYWDRAAASLFECMSLLGDIERDSLASVTMTAYKTDKVRRMGQYIYNMYIANNYSVNFADAHDTRSVVQLNVLYPFALFLNDTEMRSFAAWIAADKNFFGDPGELYSHSGNYPTLGRELMLHRCLQQLIAEEPKEPRTEAWLADLQIKTMRTGDVFVAFKGGNNAESHNHNDVGSFIVYAGGEPLLIDPGVGEYTAKTFSKERYTIWTMQSAYHNLPKINGVDQKDGKQYCAKVVKQSPHSLTLDIAGAYPKEAAVKSWLRTVSVAKGEVNVTEKYRLAERKEKTQLMFITTVRPEVAAKGKVRIGVHELAFPASVDVKVEDLSAFCDPSLVYQWGPHLYRLVLTLPDDKLEGDVSYRIK